MTQILFGILSSLFEFRFEVPHSFKGCFGRKDGAGMKSFVQFKVDKRYKRTQNSLDPIGSGVTVNGYLGSMGSLVACARLVVLTTWIELWQCQ